MTYKGVIKNNRVIFTDDVKLTDGTEVLVIPEGKIKEIKKTDEGTFVHIDEGAPSPSVQRKEITTDVIERICSGVNADNDLHPYVYTHSDRFLIIDMKNRKEILKREYRPNPYGKICREKYAVPTSLGDPISDEEKEIYRKMAEIVKDCKYVTGTNFGYYPARALEAAGTDHMMTAAQPQEWIDSLIDARLFAGFRD